MAVINKALLNFMDSEGELQQVYPVTKKENVEDLEVMGGASTSAAGTEGLAPAPPAGAATRYLRSDGTWAVPPDTTYSAATPSAAGLMSAADKAKLDGVAAEANKTTVDAALSSTSTNPVQNKAVQAAIAALPTTATVSQAISDAIDDLIGGAPATYDTLKEIADYLATHEDEYTALLSTVGGKVDKVSGKGLSTNDYTTTEKTKLSGIESGAEVNIIEQVKVNGVAQTVTSKAVDIDVPTGALADKDEVSEADLDTSLAAKVNAASEGNHSHANKTVLDGVTSTKVANWDASYTHSQAAHAPSTAQANVIESIKVNGEAQAVSSKAVDIDVPVTYIQAAQPAGLKAGDMWIQIMS